LGITVSRLEARVRLEQAFEWAASSRPVPERWKEFAEQTFRMESKTYTTALGTALLARATDDHIDPLSIKSTYAHNTYSLRTLGHDVLVPAARTLGFSIRNTGREPLNNQPFFRYDHMTTIDRVRDKNAHAQFVTGVREIGDLDRSQALAALAAFLRVAIGEAQRIGRYVVEGKNLTLQYVVAAVTSFLAEPIDRPRRAQALAAAAFDVTHGDVRSRRLNDPSRDYPGDVQAFDNGLPILAAEVRAKSVLPTEVEGFVSACRAAGIERAFMIVFWPPHQLLPRQSLRRKALDEFAVLLTIIEQVEDLLLDLFGWSDMALDKALAIFVKSVLERLREIEAIPETLSKWVTLMGNRKESGCR
jgi:hypothetical protein